MSGVSTGHSTDKPPPLAARHPFVVRSLAALVVLGFLLVGGIGTGRYVWTFWLYRGYAPPSRPVSVTLHTKAGQQKVAVRPGTVTQITVTSAALGGLRVPVLVYLPPGYGSQPGERYPVFYLLHGFPGAPAQFVDVGDVATISDTLVASERMGPMILVMPTGTTSFAYDSEWANTLRPHSNWENFVADDLVKAIDRRYSTIANGRGRAIGGLSEGGYGALNISFHHVGEFDFVEAWSPYYLADKKPAMFGGRSSLLSYNSPLLDVTSVAKRLRGAHVAVWLYCGTHDYTTKGSVRFVAELSTFHIAHTFHIYPGHHNWSLWRTMMSTSLEVAYQHLSHATPA